MNKIDPRQITLHTFSSPSGHISFVQGADYVYANLNTGIAGDLHVSGNFYVAGQKIYAGSATNTIGGTNSFVFGGVSNFTAGTINTIIGGTGNYISGLSNTIINGRNSTIYSNSSYCTAIGAGITIDGKTGAMVVGDGNSAAAKSPARNYSLLLSFQSGVDVAGDFSVNGTGHFSSNLGVAGNIYMTGELVATQSYANTLYTQATGYAAATGDALFSLVNTVSGALSVRIVATGTGLAGTISQTGNILNSKIDAQSGWALSSQSLISGELRNDLNNAATLTGSNIFAGTNTFNGTTIFGAPAYIPLTNTDSGVAGTVIFGTDGYIYFATGTNAWVRFHNGGAF